MELKGKQIGLGLIFSCCIYSAGATHIVGGELNYQYLSGNNYKVTLSVIRDCRNSATPFDERAAIGVYDSNHFFLFQVLVAPGDSTRLPNTSNSPCLVAPNNICYYLVHYNVVISLPQRPGGYQLAYQRCCRNNSIANISNVESTGATYYAKVPDRNIAPANSNPVFTHLPSTFICRGEPFVFQNIATDADEDSLVYQLCIPFGGGSPADPMPQPPSNPPYANIVWQSPYSFANPMGGIPLSIHPSTGVLTATPSFTGQFVYGVCVKEYRNGIYLGETRRDFQVNVVNCPKVVTASMQLPSYQCGNNLVSFQNNSTGAIKYRWDFGVASLLNDTSLSTAPKYLYPDTGQYSISLIAVSSLNPSCRDTTYQQIHLYPALLADFNHSVTFCNDTVGFADNSPADSSPVVSWDWDFGDGTHSQNPTTDHVYARGGNYKVTLTTVSQRGCIGSMRKGIDVPLIPVASFVAIADSCRPAVVFINRSLQASSFQWDLGDGMQVTTVHPEHIYKIEGEYDITMIARSTSGCYDTTSKKIDYQQFEFLGHYIPNSFSPNGDGRNDVFSISGATICEDVEMVIYNRWGRLVYRTTDLSMTWDGISGDSYVDPGVYIYFLIGRDYTRKGTITVIR